MMKPFKLQAFIGAVIIALLFSSCKKQEKESNNTFKITVTGGEHFPKGSRVAIYRHDTIETPQGVEFLKTEEFTDDKFTYEGTVNDVHTIFIDVLKPNSEYPFNRITTPLEPGNMQIDYTGLREYKFNGGKYGELLVNSLNNNEKLSKATIEINEFEKTIDFNDSLQVKKYFDLSDKANAIGQKIMGEILEKNDDPLLEIMAYEVGYHADPKVDKTARLNELTKKIGLNHRQSKVILLRMKLAKESAEARSNIGIGSIIKDFEAKNLKGETFHLANVLKENKYVLVEFWASWCGPCRGEIPHMKQAYEQYKNKGFEIVSFSLDVKKDDWEIASEEENIPWINTGDLLANTSPVVKLYGVIGLPANYLVEASTGKIIAKDLRQKKLDEKLAELLK